MAPPEQRNADEALAIIEDRMRGIQDTTADTQIMVKDLSGAVYKMHGTVESMKEQATEDRKECGKTSRHLAKVEERVETMRTGVASSQNLPTAKSGNEWSLMPKQWAYVSALAIPFFVGAVELFIKLYKAIS